MMTNDAALERINQAQTNLGQALAVWDGANLSSIENANQLLDESVSCLREFRDAVALGVVVPTPRMRREVVGMKNQIRHLTRIVDASSAFVQGLAVYAGVRSSTYNAFGEVQDANLLSGRESQVHPCRTY